MVRLAVLSDTHGRGPGAAAALELLCRRDPHAFVHCGDVGDRRLGPAAVLDELENAAAGRPVYLVPGNADAAGLREEAEGRGFVCGPGPLALPADLTGGVRVGVVHGHERGGPASAAGSGRFEVVCRGHSHRRRWERVGETWVLNPGACWRAAVRSAAVLTLVPGGPPGCEFLEVPKGDLADASG